MRIGAVRTAIAAAVAAEVAGLECRGFMPARPPVPGFCMEEVRIPRPRVTMRGMQQIELTAYLFASSADDETGQGLLDAWLSDTGDASVLAALFTLRRGVSDAKTLHVSEVDGYRMYEVGEAMLYGARLTIEVTG